MSFVYVISDWVKTKVGFSSDPARRVEEVASSVFSSRSSRLEVLVIPSPSARRVEAIIKSVLSDTAESAGGAHPTETFFVGFNDASAIARWAAMLVMAELTASLIGYRKKSIKPIGAKCKKINMRVAMIRNNTKIAWLAKEANVSASAMRKAASGSRMTRCGIVAMANAANYMGMKVSELVKLGE